MSNSETPQQSDEAPPHRGFVSAGEALTWLAFGRPQADAWKAHLTDRLVRRLGPEAYSLANPVALALAVERRIASGDADEDERRMLAALNAAFEEERDWNQRLRAAAERLMAALIDRELVAYGKRDKRLMAPDHEARLAEIPWEDLVEDGVTLTLRGRMQQQPNLLVAGINGRPGYGSVRFRAADIAALAASYRPWGGTPPVGAAAAHAAPPPPARPADTPAAMPDDSTPPVAQTPPAGPAADVLREPDHAAPSGTMPAATEERTTAAPAGAALGASASSTDAGVVFPQDPRSRRGEHDVSAPPEDSATPTARAESDPAQGRHTHPAWEARIDALPRRDQEALRAMMAIAVEEFTRSGRRLQRDELARRAGEKGHAVRRSRRLYKELPDHLRNQARIAGARVR